MLTFQHAPATINELLLLLASAVPSPSGIPSAASLNAPNASGNTPLHWAAINGHLESVKALVGAGADPARVNRAGKEAVFEAEGAGKGEVVEWLLGEGRGLEGEGEGGGAGVGVEMVGEGEAEGDGGL